VADDVRAAGTGWFAALMLLLLLSLVIVGVVTAVKCRIGAIYPGICTALSQCSFYSSTSYVDIFTVISVIKCFASTG